MSDLDSSSTSGKILTLEFPAPARVWSINQSNGAHWSKYHNDKKEWQRAARYAALPKVWALGTFPPSTVTVTLPFARHSAKRDPHNYTSTVVKAIIDGIVYSGAWPDDGPEWVTVNDPILVKDPELMVKVELVART